jgi:guanine deaminase
MGTLRCMAMWTEGPDDLRFLPDAYLAWDEAGRITDARPWAGEPVDRHAPHSVAVPGFVDGHVHAPQTRIVGAASGPLLDWLDRSTFPEEARFADPAHAAAVYDRFAGMLAASGTTLAMVYGSAHPAAADVLCATLDRAGLRALCGPVLMDEGAPDALLLPADRALDALGALADRWHGRDGRLEIAVIPRFALSCSMGMMQGAAALAAARGLRVSTHLSENPAEVDAVRARFGLGYVEVYERAGLLQPGVVMAHCIHPTEAEWARLAAVDAVVAHCPDSNDFLGSGGMPPGQPLRCVLGTDVAAGRSFRVPRVASAAFDNALRQGRRVAPVTWLWHATAGGAAALGHPELGALRPGAPADLALHDLPPWVEDAEAALGWLIFGADAPPCRATWVQGRAVWDRDVHGALWPIYASPTPAGGAR